MSSPIPPWLLSLSDRFDVSGEVAQGGMATLYRALDRKHGRDVALKVVKPEVTASVGGERFLREIQTVARLQHPRILPLYDSGEVDGNLYYSMPFIEGETLQQRLARVGQMELEEALKITQEVGEALAFAHERQVVHRDVKPGNVMLYRGHALVTDFGIARALEAGGSELTGTGLALGTPHYMSPEQIGSDATLDARTDQYALACMLYEMLVGEPPFTGRTAQTVLARHLADPVPSMLTVRPSLPPWIDAVVAKALSKSPADRYPTMEKFLAALASPVTRGRDRRPVVRRAALALGLILALAAGSEAVRRLVFDGRATGAVEEVRRIAVLPFTNASGDPENEYLSEGVAEELTTTLSRLPGLRLASRLAASAHKGTTDLRGAAESLGVDLLLTGTLSLAGDEMRVSVELVDPATSATLWAESYRPRRSDVSGIFEMQQGVARSIADSLSLRLVPGAESRVARSYTESAEAQDLYWRGRYLWNLRDPASLQQAMALFQASLAADPEYPLAYTGVADVLVQIGSYSVQPPRAVYPQARQAVQTALSLADDIAPAYNSAGLISLFYDWDLQRASQEFDRALALDPDYTLAHMGKSLQLMAEGRDEEAIAAARRATEADPFSVPARENLGRILYQVGRFEEAVTSLRETVALDPRSFRARGYLAHSLLALGAYEEAARLAEEVSNATGGLHLARVGLAVTYARMGRTAEAQEILDGLLVQAQAEYVPNYKIGVVHEALGQLDQAYFRLEAALRERESFVIQIEDDPWLFDRREEPRFKELVTRITPLSAEGG